MCASLLLLTSTSKHIGFAWDSYIEMRLLSSCAIFADYFFCHLKRRVAVKPWPAVTVTHMHAEVSSIGKLTGGTLKSVAGFSWDTLYTPASYAQSYDQ
jgi:hypothetical protein